MTQATAANKRNQLTPCPRCQTPVSDLMSVDTGMRVAIQTTGGDTALPDRVCLNCFNSLTGQVSQGVKLRAQQKAKEQTKMMMWKGRTNLVKHARQLMIAKAFAEAAVAYEKYLRVLEVVHELKPGELNPGLFNKSARSKELTVVASVYWDLFRIYDTSPRYADRMQAAGNKLALFLPYSTIFPDIVKKAESFVRSAKNPHMVKNFLKSCRSYKGKCFVATAIFKAPASAELQILRRFRDEYLRKTTTGRWWIATYYRIGPHIVQMIEQSPWIKSIMARGLRLLVSILRAWFAKKHLTHYESSNEFICQKH